MFFKRCSETTETLINRFNTTIFCVFEKDRGTKRTQNADEMAYVETQNRRLHDTQNFSLCPTSKKGAQKGRKIQNFVKNTASERNFRRRPSFNISFAYKRLFRLHQRHRNCNSRPNHRVVALRKWVFHPFSSLCSLFRIRLYYQWFFDCISNC